MPTINFPDNRGIRHSWNSLEVNLAGQSKELIAMKSISYDDSLTGAKVIGTSPVPIGRTLGAYEASGSIDIYLAEFYAFLQELSGGADGFKELAFDIVVRHSENGYDVITDRLLGCRIEKNPNENSQGAEASVRKVSLSVMEIVWNGQRSVRRRF